MIIEHRTFRLAADVDEDAFLAADRRVQAEVAPFRYGFVRRTTARGEDGRWLVETLWFDHASASAEVQDPVVDAFDALVDGASERIERWSTLD